MGLSLLMLGGTIAVAAPAVALDGRCSIVPFTPYKSGTSFAYGANVNCGTWAGARIITAFVGTPQAPGN